MPTEHQKIRFQFIEMLGYWNGIFENKDIQKQFNLSRQHAYNDICLYKALYPNAVIKLKIGFMFTIEHINFLSQNPFINDHALFLHWLNTKTFCAAPVNTHYNLPKHKVSRFLIQTFNEAMLRQYRLDLDYISPNHPLEQDGRIFHPHAYFNTHLHWLVRGYCEKSRSYQSLILSRCQGEIELLDASNHPAEKDTDWNTYIDLIFQPNPALSKAQKEIISREFDMQDGRLVSRVRLALVRFVLIDLEFKLQGGICMSVPFQLVLENQTEIETALQCTFNEMCFDHQQL